MILLPALATLASVAAVPFAPVDTTAPPPPPTCATYSIEGSLDGTPGPQTVDTNAAQLEISATAFLHEGSEPLVGHRVVAVFDMADGVPAVEPVAAVTDADGRVSILLPVGAIGVSFRAESAALGECPDVAPGDVPVVVVDVPVLPPGFGEVADPTPQPDGADVEAELPVTGPRDGVVLFAGLFLAAGLGTLATRVRRTAEEPGGRPR